MRRTFYALLAAVVVLPAIPAAARHETSNDDFDPHRFEEPLVIDNEYYPLDPGMQLILRGRDADGPHRLVVTVTDVVKRINGVLTLGVSEQDFGLNRRGRYVLREDELTFLAQDDDDNVWRLAEYPEEFEHGSFLGAPDTWVAGQARAIPGLYMRGEPEEHTSSYSLVFAPRAGDEGGVDDQGRIVDDDRDDVCVPAGCFDDVLVVEEQNVREVGDCCQLKYHAPGVGNIRAEAAGDVTQEVLSLVKVRRLSPAELKAASEQVLALDRRAYETGDSKRLWSETAPARRR